MKNIAVLASGGGSNLQAIIDACSSGALPGTKVAVTISNNSKAYVLQRARDAGVPAFNLSQISTKGDLENVMLEVLKDHDIDLIFLAGYLKKLPPAVIETYQGKILNIHPALLPKYGCTGMYGMNVHKAVIDAGETETGITIHHVDLEYDTGEIVAQCTVPVRPTDTPEALAARVLTREHLFIVETLRGILCQDF